jgi:hypothetical protein
MAKLFVVLSVANNLQMNVLDLRKAHKNPRNVLLSINEYQQLRMTNTLSETGGEMVICP